MKLDYLVFLQLIRLAKANLYVASIEKFLPQILVLDHIHYARWLTVYHHFMESLCQNSLKRMVAPLFIEQGIHLLL